MDVTLNPEVKLRTDDRTIEEVRAMNSSVKSYNLNKPMDWETFKSLGPELTKEYIEKIRRRFHPTDSDIASMFGVSAASLSTALKKYNLNAVYDQKAIRDMDGWKAWCSGEDIPLSEPMPKPKFVPELVVPKPITLPSAVVPEQEAAKPVAKGQSGIVAASGNITLEGDAAEALLLLSSILAGQNVRLTVDWIKIDKNEGKGEKE